MGMLMMILLQGCLKEAVILNEEGNIYEPVSKGSNWVYKYIYGDFMRDATGECIQRYGKTYFIKIETNMNGGRDTGYYAFKDDVYYRLNEFNLKNEYESIYMKNNVREGDSWTYTDKFNWTEKTNRVTIVKRNLTIIVNGYTYRNVVQSRLQYGNSTTTRDRYYAKGIGLIKVIDEYGKVIQELQQYSIK
jgi:hypothetical protein